MGHAKFLGGSCGRHGYGFRPGWQVGHAHQVVGGGHQVAGQARARHASAAGASQDAHRPHPAEDLLHSLAVVAELARLLLPSGRLLLVDVMADPDPLLDNLLNALEILRDPSHVRDHSQAQW